MVLLQARCDFAAGAAAGGVDALVAAYLTIRDVAQSCNIGAVWAAERSARDVVVLHLREGEPPNARGIFVERAEAAFGDACSRELRSILLLAYHKLNRPLKGIGQPPRRRRGAAVPPDAEGARASSPAPVDAFD